MNFRVMKVEDIIIDLQATISNLNIQYGNKPGYRGTSHHIYLEVWRKEIELNIDQNILKVWYHLGHKTIFYRLQYSHNSEYIKFNVQTEGYGNTEDERGSDWFYTAEEAILFIKNKLIYIYEKYPKK